MANGTNGNDTLQGGAGPDILNGLGGNDLLLGLNLNDTLNGGSGNDTLNGGTGADSMNGGDNNDVYYVDNAGDTAAEFYNDTLGGVDLVYSTVTHALGSGIENLTLQGWSNINGSGNGNANALTGNFGNNVLTGAVGNDTLNGGTGNDTLNGGTGNDTLNGGTGADSMDGGDQNDVYYVDNTGDTVAEFHNDTLGGVDRVLSTVTHTLGFGIENLTLQGLTHINGTGNANANFLIGNGGNNVLIGDAGNDTLNGGTGNDILSGGTGADSMNGGTGDDGYHVDSTGDLVIEAPGGGTDHVTSFVSYHLGNQVENLLLTGFDTKGIGNDLANSIGGSNGNNLLDGGGGNDGLSGYLGNDTLYGGAGDINPGNDALDGGAGNDVIYGEIGNDTLWGGEGADRLDGGSGLDWLCGGAGSDRFVFDHYTESSVGQPDVLRAQGINDVFDNPGAVGGDVIDVSALRTGQFLWGSTLWAVNGTNSNTVVYGNVDADATIEFELHIEDGGVLAGAYTAADFIL